MIHEGGSHRIRAVSRNLSDVDSVECLSLVLHIGNTITNTQNIAVTPRKGSAG